MNRFSLVAAVSLVLAAACSPAAQPAGPAATQGPAAPTAPSPVVAPSSPVAPTGPLTQITIAIPNVGPTFTPLYVARDLGIFARYGFDVQITSGSPQTAAAGITAREIDFMTATGSATRFALSGLPLRVVMVTQNRPVELLIGKKGLTDLNQLKGEVIAEYAPGNAVNTETTILLQAYGLNPGDYSVIQAGDSPSRAAVLASGQAAATLLETPTAFPLEQQGYHILARTIDKIELPVNGLATSPANIQDKRPFVQSVVQAMLEALNVVRTQKDAVVPVLEKEFDEDPDVASATYDDLLPGWSTDGRPTQTAMTADLAAAAQELSLPQATPDQVYDLSIVDALQGR